MRQNPREINNASVMRAIETQWGWSMFWNMWVVSPWTTIGASIRPPRPRCSPVSTLTHTISPINWMSSREQFMYRAPKGRRKCLLQVEGRCRHETSSTQPRSSGEASAKDISLLGNNTGWSETVQSVPKAGIWQEYEEVYLR